MVSHLSGVHDINDNAKQHWTIPNEKLLRATVD